jgi:hypothetical protein
MLRERNLKKLFGDAFVEVICLDTGADKDEILLELAGKYEGNNWIEDKPENIRAGVNAGFNGILMEHGHNMNNPEGYVVKNWEEIYHYVINQGLTT